MDGDRQALLVSPPRQVQDAHAADRKAILLLGTSGCGTSLLGHLLHTLGAARAKDPIGHGFDAPFAASEPTEFAAINDDILCALGRGWDDPRAINSGWFHSSAARPFIERIVVQIGRSYGGAPLILLSDRRLCRLAPLYLTALDCLDIEPLIVLQLRPLAEFVRSLADRHEVDAAQAEFLWLRAIIEAEWASRGCHRVWVTLGQVIADWYGTADRIAAGLRIRWTVDRDAAAQEAARFLKPRRCRGAPSIDGQMEAPQRLATLVWRAVECGLLGDEAAAQAAFDALRPAVAEWDRLYASCLARMEERHRTALAAIYASRSWRLTAPVRAIERMSE